MNHSLAGMLPWTGLLFLWACASPGALRTRPGGPPPSRSQAEPSPAGAPGAPADPPSRVYRERIEWINVWIPDATVNLLPRVLLVGDSITQGYYGKVAGLLSGKAYVGRLTTSLSVCDPKFLDVLKPVLESFHFAVVQFNNGIHGADYPLEAYRKGLEKAFRFLRAEARGARLIWASTTPARFQPENKARNAQILARNRVALELCKKYGFPVNDLYALSKDLDPLHRDSFHYRAEAIRTQARAVARFVQKFLPKKR